MACQFLSFCLPWLLNIHFLTASSVDSCNWTVCEIVDADVGFMMRKLAAVAKPNVIISIDGEQWTIRAETSFTTSESTFELSKEFDDVTPDGRKVVVSKKVGFFYSAT